MIRHVVMWRLRGPSPDDKRRQGERVQRALESLLGVVPGMSSLEVGVAGAGDEHGADVVLISTHDDWEALAAYQKHPAHLEVARLIAEFKTERRVLDFEVTDPDGS
jgi:hypothetical protein